MRERGALAEKYENCGGAIPVENRTSLVCKQSQIKDQQHFLIFCNRYYVATGVI